MGTKFSINYVMFLYEPKKEDCQLKMYIPFNNQRLFQGQKGKPQCRHVHVG